MLSSSRSALCPKKATSWHRTQVQLKLSINSECVGVPGFKPSNGANERGGGLFWRLRVASLAGWGCVGAFAKVVVEGLKRLEFLTLLPARGNPTDWLKREDSLKPRHPDFFALLSVVYTSSV